MKSEKMTRVVALAILVPLYVLVHVFTLGRTFVDACLNLGVLVVVSLVFRLVGALWKKRRRRRDDNDQ